VETIYKYPLPSDPLSAINMPMGAKVLCVKTQGGQDICLWAIVDTDAAYEFRRFCVIGTGKSIPRSDGTTLKYIDTVLLFGGKLVYHVFEVVSA
jgi:hypothetical protein